MNKVFHCDGKSRVYENFLTEEECVELYNFMHNFPYDKLQEYKVARYFNKRQISRRQMQDQPGFENVMDSIQPTLDKINTRLKEILNEDDQEADWNIGEYILMRVFKDGIPEDYARNKDEGMFLHVDNHDWMEGKVFWGVVVYLNDDYVGGELYYPEYDHYYKPKRKDLIMHVGDIIHGVKEVTEGTRYAATVLVRIKGRYNEKPLPLKEDDTDGRYLYPPGYWGKRMPDDPIQGDIKIPRSDGTFAEYNPNPTLYIPKI
jgi:hypothetical protein